MIATYKNPRVGPVGIHHVIINGKQVLKDNKIIFSKAGQILRKLKEDFAL